MENFPHKHTGKIAGTLSCFDRLLFKGHLPLTWSEAFEAFLDRQGILRKNLDAFVKQLSLRRKTHVEDMARRTGRPFQYLAGYTCDKDDRARDIARRDHGTSGLIGLFSPRETFRSFSLRYGKDRPRLVPADRCGLVLSFSFRDREFGFLHVRLETWFPLTVQVYIKGHEWPARKMDRHPLGYRKIDNAFTRLDDPARAQRFAEAMAKKPGPRFLYRRLAEGDR